MHNRCDATTARYATACRELGARLGVPVLDTNMAMRDEASGQPREDLFAARFLHTSTIQTFQLAQHTRTHKQYDL